MSPRAWLHGLRALLAVTGLVPWLASLAGPRARELFPLFAGICHQRLERTLTLGGGPMVVCSRCAGLYAGMALGAALPLPARLLPHGRALVLAALALTVLDVATQDLGLHAPYHPTRLATGLLLGFFGSAFLLGSVRREIARGG